MGYYDEIRMLKNISAWLKAMMARFSSGCFSTWQMDRASWSLEWGLEKIRNYSNNITNPRGSDSSQIFVERYVKTILVQMSSFWMPSVLRLRDASMRFTPIKYCSFLTIADVPIVGITTPEALQDRGVVMHSLWYGEDMEEYGEMLAQHTIDSFVKLIQGKFDLLEAEQYAEMEKNDSLYVLLKKK